MMGLDFGRRHVVTLGGLLALGGMTGGRLPSQPGTQKRRLDPDTRWAINYGRVTDPAVARGYHLLVLEPDHAQEPGEFRGPRSMVLGYISLGEVERQRSFAGELQRAGAIREANPHWPDARYVDLRHPAWRSMVLDRLVPNILAAGYDGIFLDTLDNAEALERADPSGNAGMVTAAVSLVQAIRHRFPDAFVMMNRGYAALPALAKSLDAVLGEAMATRWNFAERRYVSVSPEDWDWQAQHLRAAKAINPGIALMVLDYWDPSDTRRVAELYKLERAASFIPYVSVLALDRLVAEPRP